MNQVLCMHLNNNLKLKYAHIFEVGEFTGEVGSNLDDFFALTYKLRVVPV